VYPFFGYWFSSSEPGYTLSPFYTPFLTPPGRALIFPFWIPPSGSRMLRPMYDTVKADIANAAGKLTHLRRFL